MVLRQPSASRRRRPTVHFGRIVLVGGFVIFASTDWMLLSQSALREKEPWVIRNPRQVAQWTDSPYGGNSKQVLEPSHPPKRPPTVHEVIPSLEPKYHFDTTDHVMVTLNRDIDATLPTAMSSSNETRSQQIWQEWIWPHSILSWDKLFVIVNATTTTVHVHSKMPRNHSPRLVCDAREGEFQGGEHFPHVMQRLYSCLSLWRSIRERSPKELNDDPTVHDSTIPWLIPPQGIPDGSFLPQFIQALQDALGVQLMMTEEHQVATTIINTTENVAAEPPPSRTTIVQRRGAIGSFRHDAARGFAMAQALDGNRLRDGILSYYNITTHQDHHHAPLSLAGCAPMRATGDAYPESHKRLPVIGFLNRQGTRRTTNHEELVKVIQERFGARGNNNQSFQTNNIRRNDNNTDDFVFYYQDSFDGMSFLEQITFMAKVDLIIGPHGAQLTTIPFLPNCGAVLEFLPKGYIYQHYFGSLATATGHGHMTLYTGQNQTKDGTYFMKTLPRRNKVRRKSIWVDPVVLVNAMEHMIDNWQKCCRRQQS